MITVILILITVITSWNCFKNPLLLDRLSLKPYIVISKGQFYRLFSHSFLHSTWEHLLFNMMSLYFIGVYVEKIFFITFGQQAHYLYLILYFGGCIFASIYSLITQRNNKDYSAIGASGAVSSVIFAFILFEPLQKLYLFAIPIGIPAVLFGIIYLASSFYLSKRKSDNIAHDAHIAGALWGFLFPIILKNELFLNFIHSCLQY